MTKTRPIRALALAFALLLVTSIRPAGAVVYHGAPNLQLTVDLVTAGTGPSGFDAQLMFKNLYGAKTPDEAAKLTKENGAAGVKAFFKLMDHSIAFVLAAVKKDKVKLPSATPNVGAATLAAELRDAGTGSSGKYDVGYMIERLISHPYHHLLMQDLDKTYPHAEVAVFHTVLGEAISDSKPE